MPDQTNLDKTPYYHPTEFLDCVKAVFKRYFQFSGRARRSEFWYFALFGLVVGIALDTVDSILFDPYMLLGLIFSLITFVPWISLSARRLHDLDKSGWWQLIGFVPIIGWIVLIYWLAKKGDKDSNRFGAA